MTEPLAQGDQLGDFEIVSVAGAGGMGIVYKARQKSLDRDVALKVIREEIASESEYRKRFLREARLAASVDHPHVVSVYDVGNEDDRLYLVMQWIDGSDLKEQLAESGRLPPKRALAIGTQLAGALDALHSISGLIHRDVKPANVLLRDVGGEDHAYLTDFGIAKPPEAIDNLTKTGSTVGTTGYLSPEQIQGAEAGPRSDLYSLGCLVFEMLTGRKPFEGENELAVRWAHANDPRPLVSGALPALGHRYDDFFLRALAIDPEDRFATGREFAEALAAAQTSDSTTETTAILSPSQAHPETKIGPPTPLPPGSHRGQTPPPGYQPAYGYVTPPPPRHDRSGSPLALILLAIVAIAGIAVGALAAAGVFSSETGTTAAGQTTPHRKSAKKSHSEPTVQIPASAESCAAGLWVNSVTTCPFAENTRSAYAEANGASSLTVYSPVTGKTYEMDCEGAGTVVCRGGDNAAVYFTSAKATGQNTGEPPEPEAHVRSAPDEELQACDPNISANSVTSCPFAENVFVAYWEDYEAYGEQYETYVEAFSPATDETYGMSCTLESETVNCYGGEGAFVTFPMWAVRVY